MSRQVHDAALCSSTDSLQVSYAACYSVVSRRRRPCKTLSEARRRRRPFSILTIRQATSIHALSNADGRPLNLPHVPPITATCTYTSFSLYRSVHSGHPLFSVPRPFSLRPLCADLYITESLRLANGMPGRLGLPSKPYNSIMTGLAMATCILGTQPELRRASEKMQTGLTTTEN